MLPGADECQSPPPRRRRLPVNCANTEDPPAPAVQRSLGRAEDEEDEAAKVAEDFAKFDIGGKDQTQQTDSVAMDAIARARELITEKNEFDVLQNKRWEELPLFHPGKTYSANQATNGFRVMDGFTVSYNHDGDVHISQKREGEYEASKTITVINNWSDGGLSWMYWTNKAPMGSNGMLLSECVVRYGMGGWVDTKNDRRAKVIFLDSDRSIKPGRCFIIAMDTPSNGTRLLVKGNEINEDVFCVYRSAVPDGIQKVITLRECLNMKMLLAAKGDESMRMPAWWRLGGAHMVGRKVLYFSAW